MSKILHNRFEIDDNTVKDLWGERKLILEKKEKSYLDAKYKAGFIQPADYDDETGKILLDAYEPETLSGKSMLPEPEVLKNMKPLLLGLEWLQENGKIYGSLSPDKILITENGYFLKDFGTGETSETVNDYSAYEYYAFHGKGTKMSDVYSISAILYELFTGIHLANAEARVDNKEYEPLTAFGISERTNKVIEKGLKIFADDRYPDIASFIQNLYDEKEIENYKNDWNIIIRKTRTQDEDIQEKIAKQGKNGNEDFYEEKEPDPDLWGEEPPDHKKKYIFLAAIMAVVLIAVFALSFASQKAEPVENVKEIQMSAMPVSNGDIDYSDAEPATGSAVTGTAATGSAAAPTITVSTPTPEKTQKPTSVPTKKPQKTPKPTKKPKNTPKPTKKPVIKATARPTKKPRKTAKPTKKPIKIKDDNFIVE